MNTLEYFKERFDRLQSESGEKKLNVLRNNAFHLFERLGIPTVRQEEWKYTRISGLFNKGFQIHLDKNIGIGDTIDLNAFRLPGYEQANELVFINGIFSAGLSTIRSSELVVLSLEEAANDEYSDVVSHNLGHSQQYQKDGINALNTAFVHGGVFIHVKRGKTAEHPVYIYQITDARSSNILAQPRSLIHIAERAQIKIVETYVTIGSEESFTNEVLEFVVEDDARLEYYKIQNDKADTNQVSTTHIRQTGKSYVHSVVISLNGGIVRNNTNVVMEADHCEAHLYGLYLLNGNTHVDNHTIVDNVKPNCFSNELYKGVMADNTTGVFNGKIFVRADAQKTNAYQSNKNILLSDNASVNTKPQLEIYADDVKCSHGCTVGQLNEESLFYLRSRGISDKVAVSLLLHAFAVDILEQIKLDPVRAYIDELISKRMEFDQV